MILLHHAGEPIHLRTRTSRVHSGLQAPHGKKPVGLAVGEPAGVAGDLLDHGRGRPEVRLDGHQQTSKTTRRYTDDVKVRAIQQQTLSDYLGIRTEALLPEGVAQNHSVASLVIFGQKGTAQESINS